jgi:hypothetical protein|tara:strand:+ start:1827 stop:2795 length:969 start_codon:yes stop_codon:yes gene_type:complete
MASLAVANTYDRVGIREDLTEAIYNISPTDTPFVSMVGTTKATQTKHEWQTDALASAGDSKVEQGAAAPGTAAAATTRIYNECQINAKDVSVSGTDAVVRNAGRKSEMAYQLAKRGKELKLDMEWACVNTPNVRVTGASGTAAEISNVYAYIADNGSFSTSGSTSAAGAGTGAGIATETGDDRVFAEALLTDAIQDQWVDGGNANVVMLSATNKALLTAFNGRSTSASTNTDAHTKKIINAVDIYVSDYGDMSVVPNRQIPTGANGRVLVLDPSTWSIAFLRQFKTFDLAVTGDATSKELLVEWTLEGRAKDGNALIQDLTT